MLTIGSEEGWNITIGSNRNIEATRGFFSGGFRNETWSPKYIGLDFYLFYIELNWPLSYWRDA